MPSRDDYTYRYLTESDGTLPGASFREQTEAFLAALQNAIDGVSDESGEATEEASAALALANTAKNTADAAISTALAAQTTAGLAYDAASNALSTAVTVQEEQEKLRRIVEILSGGKNTIRFNADGVPSLFYRLPMFYLDDVVSSWPHVPHPAFILNDGEDGQPHILREILIGVYEAALDNPDQEQATCVVSQPGKQCYTYQPFDLMLAYCRANNIKGGIRVDYQRYRDTIRNTYRDSAGNIVTTPIPQECTSPEGWNYVVTQRDGSAELDLHSHFHMLTNAEYSALALWCFMNGYEPSGNSWYGKNHFYQGERGSYPARRYNYNTGEWEEYNGMPNNADNHSGGLTGNCPVVTGTAPNTWRHDGSPIGVENIVGNVAVWCAGVRTYNGELQTFVNNNAALPDADFCGRVPLSPNNAYDNLADKQDAINRQAYYDSPYKGYRALDPNGLPVKPGSTQTTLKLDGSWGRNNVLTPYLTDSEGTQTAYAEGTAIPDGSTLTPWGNGYIGVSTAIEVPDSGGTDLTPYYYDNGTFVVRATSDGGHVNGSAYRDFDTLAAIPDNPASPTDFTRQTDICPGYMARALMLYPICSHADIFPSVDAAIAADKSETDPATGNMTANIHKSYYCVHNGYAIVRSSAITAATTLNLAATYTARVLFGSETAYRTISEAVSAAIPAGGRAVELAIPAAKTVTGEDLGVTGDMGSYIVDLTSVAITSVSDGISTYTVDTAGDFAGERAVSSDATPIVVQLFTTFVVDSEVKGLYGQQTGRMFSRVPGDRPVVRGGTYYYEKDTYSGEDPRCSLWTTTFGNLRYDLNSAIDYSGPSGSNGDYANVKNPSNMGVGWMSGTRLACYDEDSLIEVDENLFTYDPGTGLLFPSPVKP